MEDYKFLNNIKGSKWRKWDLHIHSDSGSPDEIVDKLIEKGISVFSITDHCSVEKIDKYLIFQTKDTEGNIIEFYQKG